MEEIKLDLSQFKPTPEEMTYIQDLINRSKTIGPQIGVSWNQKVYSYLFESGIEGIDLSQIFGYDVMELEDEEGTVL